ncbi:MAG: TonB-dependent receptor [Flectobacillus sp.]|nr:TonB-dependent receptor [Flectobacillus sp.]
MKLKGIFLLLAIGLTFEGIAQTKEREKSILLDSVQVIGVTPLQGWGINRRKVPSTIQVFSAKQLANSNSIDVTDFFNRNVGSLHINETTGNPLQPDVGFRGFKASPLLGTPQGIAVYQDGVRLNETFGDVVHWDLIPKLAMRSIEIVPGSNPLFGLNALGGAISLQTKSGFSNATPIVSLSGGSFGRFIGEISIGNHQKNWAYFVAGSHFRERGWRDFSNSEASQLFGKVSYQTTHTSFDLSVSAGHSNLLGNGPLPAELLAENRTAVYTHPDMTKNSLAIFTLSGTHELKKGIKLNGNIYSRTKESYTFNGDASNYQKGKDGYLYHEEEESEEDDDDDDDDDDEPVIDQFGNKIIATEAVLSATNNITNSTQHNAGGVMQAVFESEFLGGKNLATVGVSADMGNVNFTSETELAQLTEDRSTIGSGLYDQEANVGVKVKNNTMSVYFLEHFSPIEALSIALAGRFNYTHTVLEDQIGVALNGDHTFTHFNPSLGITWRMSKNADMYMNYNLATRTPTPVELTCADPLDPCRLPNSFLSDPPLKQVVASTFEIGWRGKIKALFNWNASLFSTVLSDDIYFISAGAYRNAGYFTNIGTNLHKGLELGLNKSLGKWTGFVNYTYLNAVFGQDFIVNSPHHPEAVNGEISVKEGSRIPLIPQHIFKTSIEYQANAVFSLATDVLYNGSQYMRGDEANLLEPLKAYWLIGLRTNAQLSTHLNAFVRVNNVLNAEYTSFGMLGDPNQLPMFSSLQDKRFLTAGTPLSVQLGATWQF